MATESLPEDIQILGINEAGLEAGNELNCTGRSLPWLQELSSHDVWTEWGIAYRDVVILLPDNSVFATYNLTTHDLANPANRDAFKQLLREACAP